MRPRHSPGLSRWRLDQRGTVAVEFAMTALAFFAMLAIIIEIGLLGASDIGLVRGLERAARYAAVNGATACGSGGANSLQPVFVGGTSGLITGGVPQVSVSCTPSGQATPGTQVSVSAAVSWKPLLFPGLFSGVTLADSETATIVH